MFQEVKLSTATVKSFKAHAHRFLPEYALYLKTSVTSDTDRTHVATFVHHALAARGTQLDVHTMTSPDSSVSIAELASRVQFIRTIDVHMDRSILWINLYQFQAADRVKQKALLTLISSVLEEWTHKVDHVVCGGDWNASPCARIGYSETSATNHADAALAAWLTAGSRSSMHCSPPLEPTWSSTDDAQHEAVLDFFVTKDLATLKCTSFLSADPEHDHRGICVMIPTTAISPLPPKWDIIKPKRLRMSDWVKKRATWAQTVEKLVADLTTDPDSLNHLDTVLECTLHAAQHTLGSSGGKRNSLIPFHSAASRTLISVLRITKAARADIMKRRGCGPSPPSKSMKAAWDRDILPAAKIPFADVSDLYAPSMTDWRQAWLNALRERTAMTSVILRDLRHSEASEARMKSDLAAITRMGTPGSQEIARLLGKRPPVITPPFVSTPYPDTVIVGGLTDSQLLQAALRSVPGGLSLTIELRGDDPEHSLKIHNIPPSRLYSTLCLLEDYNDIRLATSRTQHVHLSEDRLTAWESHLASEADATHAQCRKCLQSGCLPVSDNHAPRAVRHWCQQCCTFTSLTVDPTAYQALPFSTEGIPTVPPHAPETLRGAITMADLKHHIAQLPRCKAPGDDGIVYEFLKDGPDVILQAVLTAINALLTKKSKMPAKWKGGLIRLLFKKGDPTECRNFRPVVLLRAVYKLYTAILTDRLTRIAEKYQLLHPSQEGFRNHRSTGRQAQSLLWAYQQAKKLRQPLVVTFLDFANAFNSVDHAALWQWLRTLGVPDVDLLEDLYAESYFKADTSHGTTANIFLTRGTKQGDGLSPLLFDLIFNYLLHALHQPGVGYQSTTGLQTPCRAFADDITLTTSDVDATKLFLSIVEIFCEWSGMRLNVPKSEITAYDFRSKTEPDVSNVTVNGIPLQRLPPDQQFRHLGFRFSLLGDFKAEREHITDYTMALLPIVSKHRYSSEQMTSVISSVAFSRFRYSAAFVPWSDSQLNKHHNLWIRLFKGAWRLAPGFPAAPFKFPRSHGGCPVPHPKVFLLQALTSHVEQLVTFDDDIRATACMHYQHLRMSYGCHSQSELQHALRDAKSIPNCPIAKLLKLGLDLGVSVKLPAILVGNDSEEVSWYALKCRIRQGVQPFLNTSDASSEPQDPVAEWQSTLTKWDLSVRQLVKIGILHPSMLPWKVQGSEAFWIIPSLRGKCLDANFRLLLCRWAKPAPGELPRALRVHDLRGGRPTTTRPQPLRLHPDLPAHLQAALEHALDLLRRPTCDARNLIPRIDWSTTRLNLSDSAWALACTTLQTGRIPEGPAREVANTRQALTQAGDDDLETESGREYDIYCAFHTIMHNSSTPNLALCHLFRVIAEALEPITPHQCPPEPAHSDACLPSDVPLNSHLVKFVLDDTTENTEQIGQFLVTTAKSTCRVDEMTTAGLTHCYTVAQSRLGFLRAMSSDQEQTLERAKQWLKMTELAESTHCCVSAQMWSHLQSVTGANTLIGTSPFTAGTTFASAWADPVKRDGWTESTSDPPVPLINMLDMTVKAHRSNLAWLSQTQCRPWFALTRSQSISPDLLQELHAIGNIIGHITKGSPGVQRKGSWRKGEIRTANTKDEWTLWTNNDTTTQEAIRLSNALASPCQQCLPVNHASLAWREYRHGPAAPYYDRPGYVVATDGSVQKDGCMGAAAVFLHGTRPTLRREVEGLPSSMGAELDALLMAVTDTPLDDPLTVLTDSLGSLQMLKGLTRADFRRDISLHYHRRVFRALVTTLNKRKAPTLLVKVRAHRGEPLNETADIAANEAIHEGATATPIYDELSCYFQSAGPSWNAWGTRLKIFLTDTLATHHLDRLSATHTSKDCVLNRDEDPISAPTSTREMNWTESFLAREACGRELLGDALARMRNSSQKRKLLQTIANTFPTESKLFQWNRISPSPTCRLCREGIETLCHLHCLCPALKNARISAHHFVWGVLWKFLTDRATPHWTFCKEMTAGSLASVHAPAHYANILAEWISCLRGFDDAASCPDVYTEEIFHLFSDLRTALLALPLNSATAPEWNTVIRSFRNRLSAPARREMTDALNTLRNCPSLTEILQYLDREIALLKHDNSIANDLTALQSTGNNGASIFLNSRVCLTLTKRH